MYSQIHIQDWILLIAALIISIVICSKLYMLYRKSVSSKHFSIAETSNSSTATTITAYPKQEKLLKNLQKVQKDLNDLQKDLKDAENIERIKQGLPGNFAH